MKKRIICNSFPKAGTHLLLEVARYILGDGDWYKEDEIKFPKEGENAFFGLIDERIEKYSNNFAIKGHIPWSKTIEHGLIERGFFILFIVRDPRDIIGSTYRWLTDLRKDWEISQYLNCLPDEVRLSIIINGMPILEPFNLDNHYIYWDKPLPERYENLLGWMESKNSYLVKYEYLNGDQGLENKRIIIDNILDFLGITNTTEEYQEILNNLMSKTKNSKSKTFHTGSSGTWLNYFNRYHKKAFVKLGGESLVKQLNYSPTILDIMNNNESNSNFAHKSYSNQSKTSIIKNLFRLFRDKLNAPLYQEFKQLKTMLQQLQEEIEILKKTQDQKSAWLYHNRDERMDATRTDIFEKARAEFHLERYRFACDYVKGKVVADIACGTGYGSDLLRVRGGAEKVIGVDIDSGAIQYASENHSPNGVSFICASGDATGLEDESVDIVVSFETIEHVPDDKTLLAEFHRILKPEGMLICSTPNEWGLDVAQHHLKDYNRELFEQVLSNYFKNITLYNQNSGTNSPFNREQPAAIEPTSQENQQTAECYIAVCHNKN